MTADNTPEPVDTNQQSDLQVHLTEAVHALEKNISAQASLLKKSGSFSRNQIVKAGWEKNHQHLIDTKNRIMAISTNFNEMMEVGNHFKALQDNIRHLHEETRSNVLNQDLLHEFLDRKIHTILDTKLGKTVSNVAAQSDQLNEQHGLSISERCQTFKKILCGRRREPNDIYRLLSV